MVFAIVCFGEERRYETMHLLHDLRNLGQKVYLLTNIDMRLSDFQFNNVIELKSGETQWNDFQRFIVIKYAFEHSGEEYVYYLDADSRFFDFRLEKFDNEKFHNLLDNTSFDIICSIFLDPIKTQMVTPNPNENKDIRNFTFGHDSIIDYFKLKDQNYTEIINQRQPLETVLIFRKSDKMTKFLNDMLEVMNLLIMEDKKIGRKHLACACGFAMTYISHVHKIEIISNKLVHHFFKGNFTKEVFLFNRPIQINERIF